MSDKDHRTEARKRRSYDVSATVRQLLLQRKTRNWWRALRKGDSPSRYWVRSQRAYVRNLIRGDLVAHRRMFGVSNKHVQPGEVTADQGE